MTYSLYLFFFSLWTWFPWSLHFALVQTKTFIVYLFANKCERLHLNQQKSTWKEPKFTLCSLLIHAGKFLYSLILLCGIKSTFYWLFFMAFLTKNRKILSHGKTILLNLSLTLLTALCKHNKLNSALNVQLLDPSIFRSYRILNKISPWEEKPLNSILNLCVSFIEH